MAILYDSKVRPRNRDLNLSDFFSNPRIAGMVLDQLLMLELINNIKNAGLAEGYPANAKDQSLKTQFLESDKPEVESWLHCLLFKPEFPHMKRNILIKPITWSCSKV